MRSLPTIRNILQTADNKFIGVNKPHGRVTVEKDWYLNTTGQVYGSLENGPYRWFLRSDVAPVETEVPNIESINISRSIDQDAASCTIVMSNQEMYDNDAAPTAPSWFNVENYREELGQPGYYGPGYAGGSDYSGISAGGALPGPWKNVLVPNALLRTYQGYGGFTESNGKLVPDSISTAVTNGNLALTGIWFIDTISMGTNGKIRMQCRDAGKLLMEQMIFPPLVPERFYPPSYYRYTYENVPSTPTDEGTPHTPPGPASLVYEDCSCARWLGANSSLGLLGPNAFTENEVEASLGHGWYFWNNDYAKDWWQATVSGSVNEVYISPAGAPAGGAFFLWISIMEDGVWQGALDIPYDGDDPGSNVQIYHPEKPSLDTGIKYVKSAAVEPMASINIDEKDGTWVKLDRTYAAEKIRVTIASTWYSPWGPSHYRSAVGAIKARLTEEDPVTEQPAVTEPTEQIQKDGNIKDWVDVVEEFLLWSGFLLYQGSNPTNPGVHWVRESSGTYPLEELTADLFDKKSIIEAITSIKEVLGHIFFIDEVGAVHFHSPNWWSLGNTNYDTGVRENYVHEIYDSNTLLDFTSNWTDRDSRSEIIIGSSLTGEDEDAPSQSSYNPAGIRPTGAPDYIRGLVKPAAYINAVWTIQEEQDLMAALIALHIYFNSRQGSVTIVANPEIMINDQVRIYERTSGEAWTHYVRSIDSTMNLESGEYTMSLGTNWLGEYGGEWAFDRDELEYWALRMRFTQALAK